MNIHQYNNKIIINSSESESQLLDLIIKTLKKEGWNVNSQNSFKPFKEFNNVELQRIYTSLEIENELLTKPQEFED